MGRLLEGARIRRGLIGIGALNWECVFERGRLLEGALIGRGLIGIGVLIEKWRSIGKGTLIGRRALNRIIMYLKILNQTLTKQNRAQISKELLHQHGIFQLHFHLSLAEKPRNQ